jgi:hypothetical protein
LQLAQVELEEQTRLMSVRIDPTVVQSHQLVLSRLMAVAQVRLMHSVHQRLQMLKVLQVVVVVVQLNLGRYSPVETRRHRHQALEQDMETLVEAAPQPLAEVVAVALEQ